MHFQLGRGHVQRAVDGVSLELMRGRTLALVGESGSGKSTLARAILRLNPATSGRAWFDGIDWFAADAVQTRSLRRRMQIVFQDPYGSLNPRLPIDLIVGEALEVHGLVRGREQRRRRVAELLARVGIPGEALERYPHEFSGGQRQRIGVARALALGPELLVLDEPVSALDVSVQAQVLNLLLDLQRELGVAYLFVTHNLAVAGAIADDVAVMQHGKLVEYGPIAQVLHSPRHPYTQALRASAPVLGSIAPAEV
ncbi:MAG: ATP-binding cassette domain-containing protein [Phycisphaerae bacterium]